MSLTLSEENRSSLTGLEEDMWREVTRFDQNFQEQRFSSDFFEFGRSGRIYTREQIIHEDSQPIHAVLPLPNLAIRLLDRNTAQVTYNSQVEYSGIVEYGNRVSAITSCSQFGIKLL
ncbi:MAG: nuclear transport factor 2 family protein [Leptolyngbyaceae cyanobacterium SL_1_1]|nr:nuclear transport factor 2 family protein [Leptolyngbyaceae cyanobacterium SL_1_1]